jgi:hypothetical protein
MGGYQTGLDVVEGNSLPLLGLELNPSATQPVVSRYTYCCIPPPSSKTRFSKWSILFKSSDQYFVHTSALFLARTV